MVMNIKRNSGEKKNANRVFHLVSVDLILNFLSILLTQKPYNKTIIWNTYKWFTEVQSSRID